MVWLRKPCWLQHENSKFQAPVSEPGKIEFFTKTVFFIIQVETGEVSGCPGGAHGADATFLSNFGGIWSYMASKSKFFNIFR